MVGRLWPRSIFRPLVSPRVHVVKTPPPKCLKLLLMRAHGSAALCSLLGLGGKKKEKEMRPFSIFNQVLLVGCWRGRRGVDRRLLLTPDSRNFLPGALEDVHGLVSGRCSLGRLKEKKKKKRVRKKRVTVWCVTVVKPYVGVAEGGSERGGVVGRAGRWR